MAAIIAYCSQLPPVNREPKEFKVGPLGIVLSEFGLIPLLPAEITDHDIQFVKEVKAEVSSTYGKYLSTICINCHGPNMKGGESPVPGGKYVADISSTGNPGKWSHEEFITALHTGVTPEGKNLKPDEMPWTITKNFTEDELTALLPVDKFNLENAQYNKSYLEVSDSGYAYLVKFHDFRIKGSDAPINFVREEILNIIINKRKLAFIGNIHKSIYEEALEKNNFETYLDSAVAAKN